MPPTRKRARTISPKSSGRLRRFAWWYANASLSMITGCDAPAYSRDGMVISSTVAPMSSNTLSAASTVASTSLSTSSLSGKKKWRGTPTRSPETSATSERE